MPSLSPSGGDVGRPAPLGSRRSDDSLQETRIPAALKERQDLINAYEAEEERLINILGRKLDKLRREKIELENTMEAESESHVNRLTRQLSALLVSNANGAPNGNGNGNGHGVGNGDSSGSPDHAYSRDPPLSSMVDSLRRENENLRHKLVDTERDYIRISRINDIYREELIDLRMRAGIPVDNLIGLSSDPLSQPTHHRPSSIRRVNAASNSSTSSHPTSTASSSYAPASYSSSSATSSTPPSPLLATSAQTNMTSPPSFPPFPFPLAHHTTPHILTYPSVPPPSLSSSFGSPVVTYNMPMSPGEPLSRRSSVDSWTGPMGSRRNSSARRGGSVERGGRVAETGSLAMGRGRSRAGSLAGINVPEGD